MNNIEKILVEWRKYTEQIATTAMDIEPAAGGMPDPPKDDEKTTPTTPKEAQPLKSDWIQTLRANLSKVKTKQEKDQIRSLLDIAKKAKEDDRYQKLIGSPEIVVKYVNDNPSRAFSSDALDVFVAMALNTDDSSVRDSIVGQSSSASEKNLSYFDKAMKLAQPMSPSAERGQVSEPASSDDEGLGPEMSFNVAQTKEKVSASEVAEAEGLSLEEVEEDMQERRASELFSSNIDSRFELGQLPDRVLRLFIISLIRELDDYYKKVAPNVDRKSIIRDLLDLDDDNISKLQIRSAIISEAVGEDPTYFGQARSYQRYRPTMIGSIENMLVNMIDGAFDFDPRWERINKAIESGRYGKSGPDKLKDEAGKQIFNQLKKLIKKAYNNVLSYGPVKKQMDEIEKEGIFINDTEYLSTYNLSQVDFEAEITKDDLEGIEDSEIRKTYSRDQLKNLGFSEQEIERIYK